MAASVLNGGATGAAPPPGSVPPPGAAPQPGAAPRRGPATMPARLQLIMAVLVTACLAWGAVAAWTVQRHASAAGDVVARDEPLSLAAQRMYQSLSDADVTTTTAFLAGPQQPLAARQRYQADISRAALDLASLRGDTAAAGSQQFQASLAAISAGLPAYTADVAQAQTDYSLGYLLTGGSLMQVAAEEMHLVLLPAARRSYAQENARLTAASAAATGLPWIAVAVVLALALGFTLYRAQRWLLGRTHRVINLGLLTAAVLLTAATAWLAIAFSVARADLQHGVGHGSVPAETLAQAGIAAAQARGDELVNLISRSGDGPFRQDFQAVRAKLGPGPGTLLARAATASAGGGAPPVSAAARDVRAWYALNEQAYRLDEQAQYPAETRLVIGGGPGGSAAGFSRVETDLNRAIAADQVIFHSGATAGAAAFSGLDVGIIVAAVLIAAGCAWGLGRRLAEYR